MVRYEYSGTLTIKTDENLGRSLAILASGDYWIHGTQRAGFKIPNVVIKRFMEPESISIKTGDRIIIYDDTNTIIREELIVAQKKNLGYMDIDFNVIPFFFNYSDLESFLKYFNNNHKAFLVRY